MCHTLPALELSISRQPPFVNKNKYILAVNEIEVILKYNY